MLAGRTRQPAHAPHTGRGAPAAHVRNIPTDPRGGGRGTEGRPLETTGGWVGMGKGGRGWLGQPAVPARGSAGLH